MPKQTFLNLPKEKQQRLLNAGFKEFSRVPADEASISNIIKIAAIPRGSFYQYFTDKYDLHAFIIEKYSNHLRNRWIQLLIAENGDLFRTLPRFFECFLDEIISKQEADFWKNTFSLFRSQNLSLLRTQNHRHPNETYKAFIEHADLKHLRIDITDENLKLLCSQIIAMIIQSLHQYFFDCRLNRSNSRKNAIKRFCLMLDWLENGIRK